MKDYKQIIEQRRADHAEQAGAIQSVIDEHNKAIQSLYAVQVRAVASGDQETYSGAAGEIKFLEAAINAKTAELEELNKSAVLFTSGEYQAAVQEAIRENASDYAAVKEQIEKKWQEISDLYRAFRERADSKNVLLNYLRGVAGVDENSLTTVNRGNEMSKWISESSSGMTYYQAFKL